MTARISRSEVLISDAWLLKNRYNDSRRILIMKAIVFLNLVMKGLCGAVRQRAKALRDHVKLSVVSKEDRK